MDYLFIGQLTGVLRKHLGLSLANQTIIPLTEHAFFVEAVKEFGFCSNLLRTDAGTENGIMASVQWALTGDMAAHKYRSSIANQRIENWWSSIKGVSRSGSLISSKGKRQMTDFLPAAIYTKKSHGIPFPICFKETCWNWKFFGILIEFENLMRTWLEELQINYFRSPNTLLV